MKGQWIGSYQGTNVGALILEFDEEEDHFEGRAYVFDDNYSLPATFAFIRTPDKSAKFQVKVEVSPLDPKTLDLTTWEQIANFFRA